MVIAWLTMVAPMVLLGSWLLGRPPWLWLAASLLLAPLAIAVLWRTIQTADPWLRWAVMQYFGWGAVLLPISLTGALLAIWLPPREVGFLVLIVWLLLGTAGVLAATRIGERRLAFGHDRLDRAYRLVQLSDVHVGSRRAAFLERAVRQALDHRPDVLVITGDLIDTSAVRAEDLQALGRLPCPVYLCLGNHERYLDLDHAVPLIEAQGVRTLRSEAVMHGQLELIGVDDGDDPAHLARELPTIALNGGAYRILLSPRPAGWEAARAAGIDLMLAGHTHGGQIWPFKFLVQRRFPQLVGLFSQGDRHLYVSPGTGCWGPIMRLGTRAEMTVIDLHPTGNSP
jgi:predicted MPP superfamily phosphohydrolase